MPQTNNRSSKTNTKPAQRGKRLPSGHKACWNCGEPFLPNPRCRRKDGQHFCKDACRKEFHKHGGGARVQKWMRDAVTEMRGDIAQLQGAVRMLDQTVSDLRSESAPLKTDYYDPTN